MSISAALDCPKRTNGMTETSFVASQAGLCDSCQAAGQ